MNLDRPEIRYAASLERPADDGPDWLFWLGLLGVLAVAALFAWVLLA